MALETEPKFSSPQEEVEWLKQRIQEKLTEAEKAKETKPQMEAAKEAVKEHIARPPEKTLAPEYKISEEEAGAKVLELKPEPHDRQIEELLGVLEEKGILNAVSVCRKLDPHLEDDFHRVLIQYLLEKINKEKAGFSKSKAKLFRGLKMVLYEVALPQEELKAVSQEGKTFKDFISRMEQFYSGMAAISEKKGFSLWPRPAPYFVLELALPAIGEEISFYAAIPRNQKGLLEKQLLAVFPQAQLKEKKDDYNIFNFGGASSGAVAGLRTNSVLPIRTYDKLSVDPLEIISNAFSKLKKEGEGLALQIVVSPTGDSFSRKIKNIISAVRKGEPPSKALQGEGGLAKDLFKAVVDIFGRGSSKKEENKAIKPVDEEFINLLNSKASRRAMLANIRLLASAKTKEETNVILNELKSAFSQFDEPNANGLMFKDLEGKKLEKLFYQFSFRIFDENEAYFLNTAELTSIFHFPIVPLATPKVKYLKAKDAAPPLNLPTEGLLLGENIYRDEKTAVCTLDDDRRRHLYLVGQTGTGKSVLLQNLIIQDIKVGKGVCFIDPHGDAVKEILGHIPRERLEDVIYFDPADTSRPMGLNMLDYDPAFPEQKTFIVNELLEIFNKLYNMSIAGGPMFEQYFRNAALLVMDDPESGNTLLEIERVLTDKEFREYKLSRSKNPVVKAFWKEVAEKSGGEYALANMVPYITSKFDTFLANEIMRPIIAQAHSAFNFRQIMDEKKILLINLSKGRLGDLNSNLLGLIIVGKILMAALSRTDLPEEERRDFYLYIDEFQNVTTKSIAVILSEARKYRLDLTIANQFIGQLDEDIKKAVFGNVGSMIIFRVGADDVTLLEKQVEPTFNAYDLLNIDNYNAYLKLLINGQTSRPFNIRVLPPQKGNPEIALQAQKLSSLKYGRPRDLIEEEIRQRYAAKIPKILE
ncbi:MAG: type IV secretory system conjugative DNA transfer family protein [Candidatus Tagabacteria bacterium]